VDGVAAGRDRPVQAVFAGGTRGGADTTGWTVESDSINLANAQVSVMVDGAAMPVTVAQLLGGYGSKYAISFIPMGGHAGQQDLIGVDHPAYYADLVHRAGRSRVTN